MRKLTYTQAATCGENLKVRVTPEQSEKMQLAWFAAGKVWQTGHTNIIKKPEKTCLFMDGNVLSNGDDYDFKRDRNEEIELIDDLPQHDFASQQELTLWVAQGNKVKIDEYVYGFKNGEFWNFTLCCSGDIRLHFKHPEEYKKHTSPRLIRVNGIEVPAPLESLDGFETVYIAEPAREDKYLPVHAGSYVVTQCNRGLCYATAKDAIKRAEAMVKFEVVE